MNQSNYTTSSIPPKALKRGRMEFYGCNDYGTGTYPCQQQQQQLLPQQHRPPAVLFKSHSASEAIFSSRHPPRDHIDMHNGNIRACGHYMPTPKRSRSVGSPSVLLDDYSCSPQPQQQQRLAANASCPAVVTPSRGLCAHFPQQQQQSQYYYDNHYYYGNGVGAPLDSDSFASRQHGVKLMNHEERIPTIDTAAVTNKIRFDPFHIGVQQVTPSNSCDHGESLRSLPRLDFTEDEEEPLLQTGIPDLFEPYDIMKSQITTLQALLLLMTSHLLCAMMLSKVMATLCQQAALFLPPVPKKVCFARKSIKRRYPIQKL
jgi:hypothetical protein